MAELVYLPPEPGLESDEDEPEVDETGGYIDRGWKSPRLEMSDEEWAERQAEGQWHPLPGGQQSGEPSRRDPR